MKKIKLIILLSLFINCIYANNLDIESSTLCEPVITNVSVTDDECGLEVGSIYLQMENSPENYYFYWSGSVNSQTNIAEYLAPGAYSVTIQNVTDSCLTVQTFEILNSTAGCDNNIVFDYYPPAIDVDCSYIPPAYNMTATSSCTISDVTIVLEEVIENGDCPSNYTIHRIWTASDACNNQLSYAQIIEVTDSNPPFISGNIADMVIQAGDDIPAVPDVFAFDSCTQNVALEFLETTDSTSCNTIITRSWTATDVCGNSYSANQVITIVGTGGTDTETFHDITICEGEHIIIDNEIYNTSGTYTHIYPTSQACDSIVITTLNVYPTSYNEVFNGGTCDPNEVGTDTAYYVNIFGCDSIVFYYNTLLETVYNEVSTTTCDESEVGIDTLVFNNSSTGCDSIVFQFIDFDPNCDTSGIVFDYYPPALDVDCSYIPPAYNMTATSGCTTSDVTIVLEEVTVSGNCPSNYTIHRIWTAYDACNNQTSYTQIIEVTDTTPPFISGNIGDIFIQAGDDIPGVPEVFAFDSCTQNVALEFLEITDSSSCNTIITRSWTATDVCGNSYTANQIITILGTGGDNVETIQELNICEGEYIIIDNEIYNTAGNYTHTYPTSNGCDSTVLTILTVYPTYYNEVFNGGTCDPSQAGTDTAFYVNIYGCDSIVFIYSTLFETTYHDELITTCDENELGVDTLVFNNTSTGCDSIVYQYTELDPSCAGEIVFTNYIEAMPLDCSEDPSVFEPIAYTSCSDSMVIISYTDEIEYLGCPQNYNIFRTWILSDNCGNSITKTTHFHVEDFETPILIGVPNDVTVDVLPPFPTTVEAEDNCDESVDISFTETVNPSGDSYTRTWTAIDDCGNLVTATQTITISNGTSVDTIVLQGEHCIAQWCTGVSLTNQGGSVIVNGQDYNGPITPCSNDTLNQTDLIFLANGFNEVIVTDYTTEATTTYHIYVEAYSEVVVSHTVNSLPTCGNSNGSVTLFTENFNVNYSYIWGDGTNAQTRDDLAAGTYQVTVGQAGTDCVTVYSFTLEDTASSGFAYITLITPVVYLCNDDQNGVVEYEVEYSPNLAQPETIEILDTNGNIYQNDLLPIGNYVIIVYDVNGCIAGQESFEVVPSAIEIGGIVTAQSCEELGSIDISVYGGNAPYTYSWSDLTGNITIEDRVELTAGVYSVTVTDADGCYGETEFIVDDACCDIVIDALIGEDSCGFGGGFIYLNIQNPANYSYTWAPDVGNSDRVDNLAAGTYEVTISANNFNCSTVETFVVNHQTIGCSTQNTFDTISYTINIGDTLIHQLDPTSINGDILNIVNDCPNDGGNVVQFEIDPNTSSVYILGSSEGFGLACIRIYDEDGNSHTSYLEVNVIGTSNSVIEFFITPENMFVECDQVPAPMTMEAGTTCSSDELSISFTETRIDGACSGEYTLTRTWTATDDCGTTETVSQYIFVQSTQGPEIELAWIEIAINVDEGEMVPEADPNDLIVTTNCNSETTITNSDFIVITGDGFEITRTWEVIDECGNVTTIDQHIMATGQAIWPGDTNNDGVVEGTDLFNIGFGYGLNGAERATQTINWAAQFGANWNSISPINEVDYKYADCNGDGTIAINDAFAIIQNWSLTHNFVPGSSTREDFPIDLILANISPDGWYEVDITLGDAANEVDDFYGLDFKINYPSPIVQEGSAEIVYDEHWIGTEGEDLISIQRDFYNAGYIKTAVVRNNQIGIAGSGKIGTLRFQLKEEAINQGGEINLGVTASQGVNAQAEKFELDPVSTVIDISTGVENVLSSRFVKVFPNPANEILTIKVDQSMQMEGIHILNANGQVVFQSNELLNEQSINTSQFANGIYFVKVKTEAGLINSKISIVH